MKRPKLFKSPHPIHGLETIRSLHHWAFARGVEGVDCKAPPPDRWFSVFFGKIPECNIPDTYSEALTMTSDLRFTGFDGCSVGEAAHWSVECADAQVLAGSDLPKTILFRFFVARLQGRAGSFEYDAQNAVKFSREGHFSAALPLPSGTVGGEFTPTLDYKVNHQMTGSKAQKGL